MKKFDIQRFAKRRIQVGDNLQEKTIYIDNFPAGYAKEAATFDSWDRFILMDDNDDMMVLNYFAIGQLKDEYGASDLDNQFGVLTFINPPGVVDQYIYRGTYDGNTVTNESQLSEMTICSTWISQGSSVVKTIHDNISAYRYFYIEDSHVRPLVSGDEITTNTKFYFNIPDDIYNSLSGVTNPITLNGSDGFKINCIGNGSDQTLIRFSNAMGSTEEANIYDMVSGTLNTNKSMMQNITTMDSSWVGIVETADSAHPLYNMILVDETTLGNYIEPIERPINTRRVKIGDNLRNKKIYLDISNLDNSYFNNRWSQLAEIPRDIIKCGNISLLEEYPESNNNGYSQTFSLTLLDNTVILYKVGSDDFLSWSPIEGQLEYQMPDDKDYIITETIDYLSDTEDYASLLCFYIEDNNIHPVQSGDVIDENTKTYINFPYKYSKKWSQEQSFNFIMNTEEEDNKIVMTFDYENNVLSIRDENTLPIYGTGTNVNRNKSLPIGTVVGFSIEEVPYNANNYILIDTTTLGKAPLVSTGTISYKNGGNWNKLLSLAQEQVPLRGSIVSGPIKWSAVNSTTECTDSKTLYFVFGEEETGPTYETLTAQARGATYGDSISGGSGSHILVVKNSDDEQNEYPYTVSLNGSGFYTDLEFSVVTNKPFQLGITFSYGLDTSMSSNQVSLGATLLDLNSYESFSFNTVVTGTEGVGQTYWFPTTNTNGTELTFDWLKNASLRITSSVSEYGQACLSGDTKIKTLNNDIYISDLELGDKVIDRDNQETEITKVYNHKIDTVYQIHLDNDETIECSYDHKFLVNDKKAVTAAQLKENDKLGQHTITSIDIINKELDVYEIKTESNTYTLANGIICECENI